MYAPGPVAVARDRDQYGSGRPPGVLSRKFRRAHRPAGRWLTPSSCCQTVPAVSVRPVVSTIEETGPGGSSMVK